jgi:lysophospholipase L1-like esterase
MMAGHSGESSLKPVPSRRRRQPYSKVKIPLNIYRILVRSLLAAMLVGAADVATALETISPTDSNISYTGRFNFSNPSKPEFSWPGTSIIANFEGTSLSARFNASANDDSVVVIIDDGVPVKVPLGSSSQNYALASGLSSGVHSVEIVNATESWQFDGIEFENFRVDDGSSLVVPPSRPTWKLEFYGDSNAAGYSATSQCDCGGGGNYNAYYTYPAITSRMLGAEYSNIGISGETISPEASWPISDNWDELSYGQNSPTWNFNNFTPDAVIINLGANDIWGANKNEIKTAWKDFITNNIRDVHPDAHVVLANSTGWASNEPANYVHEAVQELHISGDANVSYVKFPWLWSQAHAVVSEHAGFANILADHLAVELGLPAPTPNTLTSYGLPNGDVGNGSLERSFTSGEVDGWRSWGGNDAEYIENDVDAQDGTNYVRVTDDSGFWHGTEAAQGEQYVLKGWMRGDPGNDGNLRLEFKDQSQNIIASIPGIHPVTNSWQQFSTTGTAPPGTWQVTAVLTTSNGNTVDFDDISLEFFTDGNFNHDDTFDGQDFLAWQRGESPNPLSPSDLGVWKANYGSAAPFSTIAATVPEPASVLLLLVAAGLAWVYRI